MNMEWVGNLQSDYTVGVIIVIIGLLELPLPHGSSILRPSTAHYQADISHPPHWPYMSNTNKERYGDGIYHRDGLSANLEHHDTQTEPKKTPEMVNSIRFMWVWPLRLWDVNSKLMRGISESREHWLTDRLSLALGRHPIRIDARELPILSTCMAFLRQFWTLNGYDNRLSRRV